MALANLLSSAANAGTGAAVTFTYTNSAACVIVANIVTLGGPGFVPITSVTDSSGITWHKRSGIAFTSTNFSGLSGGIKFVTQEVWWANVTATHGSAVTVTINKSNTATNEASNTTITWATFTGSLVPATPWDINGALGLSATYTNASVATVPVKSWAVSSSAAFVLGFMHQMGATGNTNVSTAPTGFTFGSAHITLGNSTTGPLQNATAWSTSGQSGSGTETFNGSSTLEWVLFTDALTSDSNGTANAAGTLSGTMTTVLNGISQSAAGKETFTGTISTALAKASISAAGAQKFVSNSVTTNLTKVSQSAAGKEIFTGTISTLLSRISQEADGTVSAPAVSITGTIESDLSGFAQIVNGKEVFSASITTTLSGMAQALSGKEVFSGSITTTLSGISQEADGHASSVMVGTIATHLAGIAQALVAEEDIIGHIATHLGEAGQLVSTDVEGLLIIEGPIVMSLSGFGQAILGGSLGTPGSGKWYSYRYLDS